MIFQKYFHVVAGLVVFVIYLFTIAPSVIQIDSGELAAVQASLGIAHPTGYPLFTISGYLFSNIPLPFSKIFLLNLLAAIWCSSGISVFIYTFKFLLDKVKDEKQSLTRKKLLKKEKKKLKISKPDSEVQAIPEVVKYLSITCAGLILAFNRTYWFQSTSVEVYSLHIFLLSLIILFLIKGFYYKEDSFRISVKNPWILFAFFLALGFTNHMTTLLVLPGAAYLFFSRYKFRKESFKKIVLMLVVFLPVLILIYLYLPVRASQQPLINWGNPVDFEKLVRHVSGKQYQVWLFSSTEAAKKQLSYFFSNLFNEFNITIFFSLVGIFSLYFFSKKIFLFISILFISTILYSINYDIVDIDAYFLLAYISISFFSLFGIISIFKILKSRSSYNLSLGLVGLFIIIQGYFNYQKTDQNDIYLFEDYTKELLKSCEKGSIILSYQWDFFISASYYFQNIEKYRKDVVIIDKELLRRSWYYNQLNANYPGLFKGIEKEVTMFLEALAPFERGEEHNPALLESLFRKIMTGLVANNIGNRNVYIAPEIFEGEMQRGEFTLPEGYTLIPDLFLFKVVKGNDYVPVKDPEFKLRIPERRNYYINMIENFTGSMLARRALYETGFDKVERAEFFINKIKNDLPGYRLSPALESVLKK